MMMRRLSILLLMAAFVAPMQAMSAEARIGFSMTPDLYDKPSLQRGARLFTDYCFGCHALGYQRYEPTADGLGVSYKIYGDLMIPSGDKIGAKMLNAMPADRSRNWFGATPPDLTNVARARGVNWIYSYLKGFYLDPKRPMGVNNVAFPNVAMPHVLYDLQGAVYWGCAMVPQVRVHKSIVPGLGSTVYQLRDPLVPGKPLLANACDQLVNIKGTGKLTPKQYDQAVYDLTNFLYFVGEPQRLQRYTIGIYVLLFLAVLYVFTYLLGREYRKASH